MKIEMEEEIKPSGESRQTEIAEPGFTPGPWGDWRREDGSLFVGTRHHVYICQLVGVERDPEVEANARLIAASPTLYEAANAALEWFKWFDHVYSTGAEINVANKLCAALALVETKE